MAMQYKCLDCFLGYIDEENLNDGCCPECNSTNVQPHCENDKPCRCGVTVHETIVLCPKCEQPMCPECGCHDVAGVSRITGYMSEYGGWGNGKKAEFKDRYRVNVA
jgi:hypothetical protein